MNEAIQQVLYNIESIKNSLEILSTDGIPIIDTFANVSTWVNIGTTFMATTFGGLVTMQLFKGQENMRITQDLRLDFFDKYKSKHFKLVEDLTELKNSIDLISLKFVRDINLVYIRKPIIVEAQNAKWILSAHTDEQYKNIKLGALVYEQTLNITRFVDYNKAIYCKGIDRYEEIFGNISEVHIILSTMNQDLRIIEIDDVNNSLIDFKINAMEEYNKSINILMEKGKVLDDSIKILIKLYEEIENEYIGKYFSPKWYQFIKIYKLKKIMKNN